MVKVINTLQACIDCVMIIANDDASGMDDATEKACREGIAAIEGYLVVGDEVGFSWKGCDVCKNGLGGDMHEVHVLK